MQVIVDIASANTDRVFTYRVPMGMINSTRHACWCPLTASAWKAWCCP